MEITKENIAKLVGKKVHSYVFMQDKKSGTTTIKVNPHIKEESVKILIKPKKENYVR
jgi:hypothetical protein